MLYRYKVLESGKTHALSEARKLDRLTGRVGFVVAFCVKCDGYHIVREEYRAKMGLQ